MKDEAGNDGEFYGVKFKEFEFKGKQYPAKNDVVLLKELRGIINAFINVGCEINTSLGVAENQPA